MHASKTTYVFMHASKGTCVFMHASKATCVHACKQGTQNFLVHGVDRVYYYQQ